MSQTMYFYTRILIIELNRKNTSTGNWFLSQVMFLLLLGFRKGSSYIHLTFAFNFLQFNMDL